MGIHQLFAPPVEWQGTGRKISSCVVDAGSIVVHLKEIVK